MGEFIALGGEELFHLDNISRFRGRVAVGPTGEGCPGPEIDEVAQIVDYCERVKRMIGDRAKGFKDSVHVLKFIAGNADLPDASHDPWPDDDSGVLICA